MLRLLKRDGLDVLIAYDADAYELRYVESSDDVPKRVRLRVRIDGKTWQEVKNDPLKAIGAVAEAIDAGFLSVASEYH